MSCEILRESEVGDGYDVLVILPSGDPHTWHFSARPEDVQAAVDELSAGLPDLALEGAVG